MATVHGKVVCKNCGTVMSKCSCVNHGNVVKYVMCVACKGDKTK